jgi:hypothetical protein
MPNPLGWGPKGRWFKSSRPDYRKPAWRRAFGGLNGGDLGRLVPKVTLLLAVGAAIAYMVPLYSATWGSPTDLLTAMAAGFGAQAIVQWAALPAFQSLQISTKNEPAAPASGPT